MLAFKKLIVCGDSYQTPSHKEQWSGTHWSEILANRFNLKLVTLANKGMSDTVIALQMLEASDYYDAIIVSSPSAGLRLEWCFPSFLDSIPRNQSAFQTADNKYPDAYMHVLSLAQCRIDDPMENAFLNNLNPNLEEYKQRCMVYYALMKLQKRKRTFLFLNNIPYKDLLDHELLEIIDQQNLVTKKQLDMTPFFIDHSTCTKEEFESDPGYHTSPEVQLTIANYIEQRIKEIVS